MYSPRIVLSFHSIATKAAIAMDVIVTTKQKTTNFVSHASCMFTVERSKNNITGSGPLKTKEFILFAKSSSMIPTLLKNNPSNISKKMGTVAFRLNIKSFIRCHLLVHYRIYSKCYYTVNPSSLQSKDTFFTCNLYSTSIFLLSG